MVDRKQTHMAREIFSIPDCTSRLLTERDGIARELGVKLKTLDPRVVTTVARGSSDHAAAYLKYVIETMFGIPVASTGPSIGSVYKTKMKLENAATIAISQSGKSPDIVTMAETAKEGGALIVSLTNASDSPLALVSGNNLDIAAGPEKSVAATKTFVSSIVAGLMLIANWNDDNRLLAALEKLPGDFERALSCDWTPLADRICARAGRDGSLYVLGRGPSFGIAKECALKFKETCQLHAEAYSSAEVLHGPVSIAQRGFPILALAARDESQEGVIESCKQMAGRGVDVFITADRATPAIGIPFAKGSNPLTDPLVQVVSFYVFVEALARRLGLDPDEPPHLRKVTETV